MSATPTADTRAAALADALPLLAEEPLLAWCLEEAATPARVAAWWSATLAVSAARPLLVRDASGAVAAVGWLSPPAASDSDATGDAPEGDVGGDGDEAAFVEVLERLERIAGAAAVERYLDCAEACDGLLPEAPCHSLSGVVARTASDLETLLAAARESVAQAPGSGGLLTWMAGDTWQPTLLAEGAQPAGEAWLPGLAVLAWWWPRAAPQDPS